MVNEELKRGVAGSNPANPKGDYSSVGRAFVNKNTCSVKIKEKRSNLKAEISNFNFFKAQRIKVKYQSFTKSLGNVSG